MRSNIDFTLDAYYIDTTPLLLRLLFVFFETLPLSKRTVAYGKVEYLVRRDRREMISARLASSEAGTVLLNGFKWYGCIKCASLNVRNGGLSCKFRRLPDDESSGCRLVFSNV